MPRRKLSSKSEKTKLLFKKPCKYIGSLAVTLLSGEERLRFINEKLLEMKDVGKGVSVVLVITDEGVKVLTESESAVKLAHGITRIAFSTCQPEQRLFAYVAKSQSVEKTTIIQAHMFKTKKNSHSQQLSLNLSEAFKIAYARNSTRRKNRVQLFENEAAERKSTSEIQSRGKAWAKVEMARGHELSGHAMRARGIFSSAEVNKVIMDADLRSSPKIATTEKTTIEENNNMTMHGQNSKDETSTTPKKNPNVEKSQDRKVSSEGKNHWSSGDDIIDIDLEPQAERNSVIGHLNILEPKSKFSDVHKGSTSLLTYENIDFDEGSSEVFLNKEDCVAEEINKQRENPPILRSRMDISRFTMTEDDILKSSEWYQPGFSREIAETVLANRSVGSFFVRESITHPGTFVMSVKVPNQFKANGTGHFLIQSLPDGYLRLQGFSMTFPSLLDLVAHYGSVQEDIPCQLRLANDNPLYMRRLYIDQPDSVHHDEETSSDEDPDYENFSSNIDIMRELSMIQEDAK